jgi:A/G-specific adenine glycosylase
VTLQKLSPHQKNIFQRNLLHWYTQNKRNFPWRRTKDPYRIWISEIMLQQTRVDTVLPYYQKFLQTFPDIRSLARAPLQKVLKSWEGMGYYARARNLHRAAKLMAKNHHARIPDQYQTLHSLPGFGLYTTAAVLSIVYHQPFAVVDGNVARVLTRLFAYRGDIQIQRTREKLFQLAQLLLSVKTPGDFNQATMELGARVCTPLNPKCDACPVFKFCRAVQLGDPTGFPVHRKKPELADRSFIIGIIQKGKKVLMRHRQQENFMGEMWEFPTAEIKSSQINNLKWKPTFEEKFVLSVTHCLPVDRTKRTYSHFTGHYTIFRMDLKKPIPGDTSCQWVPLLKLAQLPLAKVNQHVLERLVKKR